MKKALICHLIVILFASFLLASSYLRQKKYLNEKLKGYHSEGEEWILTYDKQDVCKIAFEKSDYYYAYLVISPLDYDGEIYLIKKNKNMDYALFDGAVCNFGRKSFFLEYNWYSFNLNEHETHVTIRVPLRSMYRGYIKFLVHNIKRDDGYYFLLDFYYL